MKFFFTNLNSLSLKLSIRASRWIFSSILLFVILIQTNVSSLQEDNLILKVSSESNYKYILLGGGAVLGVGLFFYFFYERFRGGKDDKPNPNANSSDSLEEPLFVEDAVNNISLVELVEGTQEVLESIIENVIPTAIIGAGIINAIPMIEEVPSLLQPVSEVLHLSSLQISSMIDDICQKMALDPDYPKRWYDFGEQCYQKTRRELPLFLQQGSSFQNALQHHTLEEVKVLYKLCVKFMFHDFFRKELAIIFIDMIGNIWPLLLRHAPAELFARELIHYKITGKPAVLVFNSLVVGEIFILPEFMEGARLSL